MSSYNKVILMGNLTRDPDVKYLESGACVAKLGLAVNSKWKGKDGTIQEDVLFIDIEFWGRQAEVAAEYLVKGRLVHVEGELKLDTWETETGEKRSRHKVRGYRLQMLGGRNDSESQQQGHAPQSQTSVTTDDGIPF